MTEKRHSIPLTIEERAIIIVALKNEAILLGSKSERWEQLIELAARIGVGAL